MPISAETVLILMGVCPWVLQVRLQPRSVSNQVYVACFLPVCCCTAKLCPCDEAISQTDSQREAQQFLMNAKGKKLVPLTMLQNLKLIS